MQGKTVRERNGAIVMCVKNFILIKEKRGRIRKKYENKQ